MADRARIALVTAQQLAGVDIDVDMPLLYAALAAEVEVAVIAWDDPSADWRAFDLAVIRSTWDYTERLPAFLAWAERCESVTRLANSAALVRWNSDKRYLAFLRSRGIPVVPTTFSSPGERASLPDGQEYVVKPAVGAGARLAARYRPTEHAAAVSHIQRLHASGITVMVQPYVTTVDTTGERALVFVGGEFVHAIRKGPVLAPGAHYDERKQAHPGMLSWPATAAEVGVARRAMAAVPTPEDPLYARVDLVDDGRGKPMVMELELIEPNLFLTGNPPSLPVVARAIVRLATAPASPRSSH